MIGYHRILRGIVQARLTGRPYRLNLSLTRRCNSRCTTCHVWELYPSRSGTGGERSAAGPEPEDELGTDELRRLFRGLPSSVMWLSFSGGEPALRADFVDVMASCFAETPGLALVNVPTNGIARRRTAAAWRELLRLRPRPFVRVSVSIDGPRERHDALRGVPGNYDRAMGLIDDLREIVRREGDAEVGVGVTVSRHNHDVAVPLVHSLLDRGLRVSVEAAHASPFYASPAADAASSTPLIDGAVAETIRELADVLHRRLWRPLSSTDWLEATHTRGTLRFLADPTRLVLPCPAATTSFAVDPYGAVDPCFFYSPGLGEIRDYDLSLTRLLDARAEAVAAARSVIAAERCPRCWLTCNSIDAIIEQKRRAPWRRLDF